VIDASFGLAKLPGRLQLALVLCAGLLVSACAVRAPVSPSVPESAWLQHRAAVETLTDWQAHGRVAIRNDDDGWSADFDWQQRGASYRIRLRGPFGQGAVELHGDSLGVWLKRQDKAPVYARDVEHLLQAETGWQLPVLGLSDWLRGLPVDSEPAALDWDQQGRLQTLQQDGWNIAYGRYRDVGERQLPDKLQLLRDQLRVKVVVDEWQVP
jgi:outer membrane lipoprotein LolB